MKKKAKYRMMEHLIIRFYKAHGAAQTTPKEDTVGRLSDPLIEQVGGSARPFISKV